MITTEHKNYIIEYYEDEHKYIVNGVIVPSVTQLLKEKFPDDYAGVSPDVLNAAAEKGSAMHKAIENYEKLGEMANVDELRGYLVLKKAFNIVNIANELPVAFFRDGIPVYAGTIDQVCTINGSLAINDFKRVSAPNKAKIKEQLRLYCLAYQQTYNKTIKKLTFMQLREKVRKLFVLADSPFDIPTAPSF